MVERGWEWMTRAERDAWVARDVMGWTDVEIVHGRVGGVAPGSNDRGRVAVPLYSRSPASALQVLDKIGETASVTLSLNGRAKGQEKRWGVHVVLAEKALRADGHHLAESDVFAEAICRAALRAVGQDA